MKRATKKAMIEVAKQEIAEWRDLPSGLVLAILWAFIHRFTEGEPFEDTLGTRSRRRCSRGDDYVI